ncbi:helix-turn-helix domain-containing protein, partial [bacterium]|nr:helix-turn-helix domain-containing protein [bacterium]
MSSTILHPNQKNTTPTIQDTPSEDEDKHPYLVGLGQRVGALRARRGMTRKALAVAAQVSERHLANMEYGLGNASVLVLLQVAKALQCTLA